MGNIKKSIRKGTRVSKPRGEEARKIARLFTPLLKRGIARSFRDRVTSRGREGNSASMHSIVETGNSAVVSKSRYESRKRGPFTLQYERYCVTEK